MSTRSGLLITVVMAVTMLWSAGSYAGCAPAQVSGLWEVAFSDGNSCRIKIKSNGTISAENSICYDPDRGTADVDSGVIKVDGSCFAEGEVLVGGVTIELPVQFSNDRGVAAGRFRLPDDGTKGSVVMVRVN